MNGCSLFVSLVYYRWKYCSLVCCERKTLLDGCWFCWSSETNRVSMHELILLPSIKWWFCYVWDLYKHINHYKVQHKLILYAVHKFALDIRDKLYKQFVCKLILSLHISWHVHKTASKHNKYGSCFVDLTETSTMV
jgi:hypothetical protein